ncbi:MAG TPA: TonB-dependent receptor [Vicinamibacteria bacterium]|nr:TonB-dependent receptor [Vicinamibacteria bacterium]
MKKLFSLGLALLLMASTGAFAQTATGNVLGVVTDASGAVLPGVAVSISGEAGTRTTVTGADGTYRFLNMDYGDYKLTFALQGFGSTSKSVTIATGASATVNASLTVGGKTETVEVTGEAPLVDVTKRGTGTTISNEQLKDVPNSRDPWGIMRNVPGAMIDRVNIAGNENGQQASIAGKGSTTGQVVWNLDGLVITDMAATGASPTYFDFDAFQEINVSTGGGDLTMQTGGFGLGFVTKRGTNTFHGGGRYIATDDKWSSSNISPELLADINKGGTANRLAGGQDYCAPESGSSRDKADHIYRIKDYGFDLGGPIIKDKLWFYATYGKQDIKLCRLNGTKDATLLPSYNAKLNWQASANTMVSAYYFIGKKQKFGRAVGFFADEAESFLWDQGEAHIDGGYPPGLLKLEINHTFSANFFVSAKAASYDTGFQLAAHGGDTQGFTLDFDNAKATGSYLTYTGRRPQKTINVDGSYFFQGLGGNNQLKFGFGYRIATTNDTTHYNGNQLGGVVSGGPYSAWVLRDAAPNNEGRYSSAYIGDVLTKDRLTVNLGVRFDGQNAKNLATTIPANKSFPTEVPAVNYAGNDSPLVDFKNFSPRVGFSYALTESRKTVLRGSYANYAAQLSYGLVNGAAVPYGFVAYGWNDFNNDRVVTPNEVDIKGGVLYTYNIDPDNRAGIAPNRIDPDLKNQRDNEIVAGIDHELAANFSVGAAYTYRSTKDLQYTPLLAAPCAVGSSCSIIQPNQYIRGTDLSARGYTVQRYTAPSALVAAGGSGTYTTNYTGYTRKYSGFELTMKKRMSSKWAANVAFAYNNWTETYSDSNRVNTNGNPTKLETGALVDGGPVSILSGGSGKASFYSSFKWQVYADAMVNLPASFTLSTAVFGRQGGIYPTNITTPLGADGSTRVLASAVDAVRYDNLWNLDFRLARNSKIGRVTITPSLELFNALNNDVVLGRARNANSATLGRVEEVISPRILRIGARLSF